MINPASLTEAINIARTVLALVFFAFAESAACSYARTGNTGA